MTAIARPGIANGYTIGTCPKVIEREDGFFTHAHIEIDIRCMVYDTGAVHISDSVATANIFFWKYTEGPPIQLIPDMVTA